MKGQAHLCFRKGEDGKLKYYESEDEKPKVAYACKVPIANIEGKEWPDLKEVEALCVGEELAEAEYYGVTVAQGENILTQLSGSKKLVKLKAREFEHTQPYDIQPIIYVRSRWALSAQA